MKLLPVLLFLTPFLIQSPLGQSSEKRAWREGVVLHPAGGDLQPGQLVKYSEQDDHKVRVKSGKQILTWPRSTVVPYDEEMIPSWVFLRLKDKRQDPASQLSLATNALLLFPDHELSDDIWFSKCDYSEDVEGRATDGKTLNETIGCLRGYLTKHPRGKHKDQAEWRLFQLETEPYEYEGDVEAILRAASRYQEFATEHPNSLYREQALFKLAKRYWMAAEAGDLLVEGARQLKEVEVKQYRRKAAGILENLQQAVNLETRETARVLLYQLTTGRRIYIGSDAWYPGP